MIEFDDAEDARLSELLRAAPLPEAPVSLVAKARRRKDRPAQRRVVVASSLVVLALVGATLMMSNRGGEPVAKATALNTEDLAALFAPPPVDPLDLLDNRQAASLRALEQLGRTP
jgi:hypothetical protein